MRWTETPREGKDSDSSEISYGFTCSVDSFGFFFLFLPSVVVVDFIGNMKSN